MTTATYTPQDEYGAPIFTEAGPRCGNHSGYTIRHENAAAIRACYAASAAQAADSYAECYAEAVASWVTTGGSPADASRYASVIASGGVWDGGIGDSPMTGETCVHGLDAGLCEGPQHYPMDSYDD